MKERARPRFANGGDGGSVASAALLYNDPKRVRIQASSIRRIEAPEAIRDICACFLAPNFTFSPIPDYLVEILSSGKQEVSCSPEPKIEPILI